MKPQDRHHQLQRKTRIEERLDPQWQEIRDHPMLEGGVARYEVSGRIRATSWGGIGLVHEFVQRIGLHRAIDARVHVFKKHFPYHESDHVLNIAYNVMAGGTCLEDIERVRNDEAYLDALGARRIPDPTTAGDFLRRFGTNELYALMSAIHDVQRRAWRRLPRAERRLARVHIDGTLVRCFGECKEGIDVSHKGVWGYHPLILSLANTQEIITCVNRSGNEVSHKGAVQAIDDGVRHVRSANFDRVRISGDTDFALTKHFDRWTQEEVEFVFGMDANPSFVEKAELLPQTAWKPLERRGRAVPRTASRRRPENVRERIVRERGFTNLILEREDFAELPYTPVRARSRGIYRMVILRKTIRVEKGQLQLGDEVRYFFYVTNVSRQELSAEEVIAESNARCNQENLIEQMKNGFHAMRMPSDSLLSNWAYMLMASLAWNIKAWMSILMPARVCEKAELRRMEFRRFVNAVMAVPCQVLRGGRTLKMRILAYSPWARMLVDGMNYLRGSPIWSR